MASKETVRESENLYHYRECGLDNIYLVNGVHHRTSPRGNRIHIENLDGRNLGMGWRGAIYPPLLVFRRHVHMDGGQPSKLNLNPGSQGTV